MDKKVITIVIPTYNRRERLLRQLESLQIQGQVNSYYLVVLDNCSDYDVNKAICEHGFKDEFYSNIEIVSRPLNTRMGYNLAGTLLYAKTKWLWLVSDDDISVNDSITNVVSYALNYPDASLIKFQFTYRNTFSDIHIHSIKDLEAIYHKHYFTPGDLFYLGNNLINTAKLQDYLGDAFEHSSHLIPFVMPALHQLVDGNAEIIFSDKHVQIYVPNKSGDTWMAIPTILKFAELFDIRWGNPEYTQRLFRIVCNHFMVTEVVRMLLSEKNESYRRYAYHRLKETIFNRPQSFKERMFWTSYFFEDRLHIPIFSRIHPWLKNKVR